MASNFFKIDSYTLSSGSAANFTFSSIPQTYKHLVLYGSLRGTASFVADNVTVLVNSTSVVDKQTMYNAANTGSINNATDPFVYPGSTGTAGAFSIFECFINDYKSSTNKVLYGQTISPNSSSSGYVFVTGARVDYNSAITQIVIQPQGGGSWAQYSSMSLYGIKD